MIFKGTIVITDPCYLDNGMDPDETTDLWEDSSYGEDLSVFGCTHYISEGTLYGDWSCFTYRGTKEDVANKMHEWNVYYFDFFNKYNSTMDAKEKEILLEEYKMKHEEFMLENTVGQFCADAGMVCVVYLDEVLKVNPNFKKWAEEHPWCATIIENFDGDVEYVIDEEEAHIVGTGSLNFYTSQCGL
jgi:hypothetical protein